LICFNCNNKNTCTKLCDKVNNILYAKHQVCKYDAGVYCMSGDPNGLYHPDCNDMICKDYATISNIKKDVEFIKYYKEFIFTNEDLDRLLHNSKHVMGDTIISDGYTQLSTPDVMLGPSKLGVVFRHSIQHFLIEDPYNILTPYQSRAIRLYFGLVTRRRYSLGDIAGVMRVHKQRIVHHISVSLVKIKSLLIWNIVGDMMNGQAERFERLGIKIDVNKKPLNMTTTMYNKIKAVLCTRSINSIVSREQFETLWLFCGFHNRRRYSVEEISDILEVSIPTIKNRIKDGVGNISLYIIDKVCDSKEPIICDARDCTSTFIPTSDSNIYCSKICRDREKERRYRENKRALKRGDEKQLGKIRCEGCGEWFTPINGEKYHNIKCYNVHNMNEEIFTKYG
jgi:hypothetical protein